MLDRKELVKTTEFWVETLQNQIYREVISFMEKNDLTRSQLAQELGVSKGYITQILNGECNFSLKKLVELSLKMKAAPIISYVEIDDYINQMEFQFNISSLLHIETNSTCQDVIEINTQKVTGALVVHCSAFTNEVSSSNSTFGVAA